MPVALWRPPLIKNGTSAPIFEQIFKIISELLVILNNCVNPLITAAALLDPPPNPAPIGILLLMQILTPLEMLNSLKNSRAAI